MSDKKLEIAKNMQVDGNELKMDVFFAVFGQQQKIFWG